MHHHTAHSPININGFNTIPSSIVQCRFAFSSAGTLLPTSYCQPLCLGSIYIDINHVLHESHSIIHMIDANLSNMHKLIRDLDLAIEWYITWIAVSLRLIYKEGLYQEVGCAWPNSSWTVLGKAPDGANIGLSSAMLSISNNKNNNIMKSEIIKNKDVLDIFLSH